ncbi:unnamed protein product [Cyclocybe aegerita]|uniref:Uncharacterized protein n=1 Tax=Cyclocybe aegerita TaxID=1973307 RepID=A0A8S0VV09_CYCAE|nr:unnamed protein product [Cyclocybe aegerita]
MDYHIRKTFDSVNKHKEDLSFLAGVVEQVELLDDARQTVRIQNRQERRECENIIEDSIRMGYLAVQYSFDTVTGGERISTALEDKIQKLDEALKAVWILISEASSPEEAFDFDSERAEVDGLLRGCLATFEMGAFHHIQGAYENARKNVDRGLKRRITLTIAPSQEPKKTKEPRRHTGPNENTRHGLQDQGTSRMLLETRPSGEVIDISDFESDAEKKTPAPARKPSKASSTKRKETAPTSPMDRQSSTSSQRSRGKGYHTIAQQGSIHEEPDEMDSGGSLDQETYRNFNREGGSSKHHRESEERTRDQRRVKTAPAVRVTRQDSVETPGPPPYCPQINHERRDAYDPRFYPSGHMPASPQPTSPASYGYPRYFSPSTPTPSFQSPLEVNPHLLSRIGPGTNVKIEDSFNVGGPPPVRRNKKNRRETDRT